MTAFQLFGGLALFGVLWIFFPRVSFVVLLGLYLRHQYGFFQVWNLSAIESLAIISIMAGVIAGFIIDVAYASLFFWKKD